MKKLVLALCAACLVSTAASASQIASPGAAVDKTTMLEWCNDGYRGH